MKVPFLDLAIHHQPIREQLDAAIAKVIDAGAFAGGAFVAAFEEEFAAYCGTRFAMGVGSGTEALWFSLLALGVGPGDEVITSPSSFLATAEAISFTGARPVFVDIEEQTYTIDPGQLARAITPRTRAIIPVHLFGQMSNMDAIMEVACAHGIPVVEDACQAHGALYKGRKAGSFGATGCFSFYPGKNLGALGEAGAVVTNDPELEQKIRALRDHGQIRKYYHSMIGWNGRMDGIQAAVLSVKLKRLEGCNERRRVVARLYRELLGGGTEIILPGTLRYNEHIYHIFAVRVKARDRVLKGMTEQGIGCGIHYPVPIHLQEAYRSLGYREGAFPVAEKCAREFLSLPMFPELTGEQAYAAAKALRFCTSRRGKQVCA